MSFAAFVVRNLVRQRARSLLTVLGIGIGITTVIALGAVTGGLRAASVDMAHLGGADFMVAQMGAADLTFSTLSEAERRLVASQRGVERAWGALLHITRVGPNPFFFAYGVSLRELPRVAGRLSAGHLPRAGNEIAIGSTAASDIPTRIGGAIEIEGARFTVVGLLESTGTYTDNGGFVSLTALQTLTRKPGVFTAVYVDVSAGANVQAVMRRIAAASDRFATVRTAEEYSQVDQGLELMDAGNLAVSVLAVLIGGIGVMNTMVMSVFERTREIGILRAVGWRGSRIVRMILGESLVLCLVATLVGVALGLAATRAVVLVPSIGALLQPRYDAALFLRALGIAVVVALAGALYPALRALRLSPMEALRHE